MHDLVSSSASSSSSSSALSPTLLDDPLLLPLLASTLVLEDAASSPSIGGALAATASERESVCVFVCVCLCVCVCACVCVCVCLELPSLAQHGVRFGGCLCWLWPRCKRPRRLFLLWAPSAPQTATNTQGHSTKKKMQPDVRVSCSVRALALL